MRITLSPLNGEHHFPHYYQALDLWRQVRTLVRGGEPDPLEDRLEDDSVSALLTLSRAEEADSAGERRRLRLDALGCFADATAVLELLRHRRRIGEDDYRRIRDRTLRNLQGLMARSGA
jgi:hypothetical protein